MKKQTIEYVNVDKIKVSPFNPAARVDEKNLKDLLNEVRDAGAVLVPLIISEDGLLADGHRRLACAKLLHIESVPVIRHSGYKNPDLWKTLNSGTRKMSALDMFQAIVLYNAPIEIVSEYMRYHIESLIDLVGIDMAREMAEKNYSPSGIHGTIRIVMRHCNRREDVEFAQFVARWLIDQRQAYQVRKAVEEGITCEEILQAINENRKLVRTWKLSE